MEPGERLRKLREDRGLSAADLAQRVERSESAVRNQENGTNGIPAGLARRYAAVLNTTAAYILYGDDSAKPAPEPTLATLPILEPAQAGAWLQVDDLYQDEPPRGASVADPRYPHARQWLVPVRGDSMNAAPRGGLHEGDLVHVVDIWGSGWRPKTGDIVLVERIRFQGREREQTLKQVEITPSGTIMLWPRSTNPRWQTPVPLRAPPGEDPEDVVVNIRGLMINLIRRFD